MTQLRERATAASADVPAVPVRRLTRLSGLDGLRAVAVTAVVIFHLDVSLAPGGFIGVDIFFVISGLLITRMLADEIAETGRIDFLAFYLRRARRLLPAVLVLIGAVIVLSLLIWRGELSTLTGSTVSSLGYVTNWWLIADHQSYFVSVGRPPMLQHLWSLAVEEQFYLVWPLLIVLTIRAVHRRQAVVAGRPVPIWAIAAVALTLAFASTLTMTLIARAEDVPYGASTSRVYFGTDTHSMGLFLGAAAGAWIMWWQRRPTSRVRSGNNVVEAAGRLATMLAGEVLALACFIALAYIIATVDEFRPELYQGGFLLIDGLVVVVVMVVIRGGSALGRLLDSGPAVWVGQRSYSIYLWHWPVVLVTRPGVDVHGPTMLLNLARIGLILLLAEASYRFVEVPFRARGLSVLVRANGRPIERASNRTTPRPLVSSDGRLALGALMAMLCLLVLVAAGSPLFAHFGTLTSSPAGLTARPPATATTARASTPASAATLVTASPAGGGGADRPTAVSTTAAGSATVVGSTPAAPAAVPVNPAPLVISAFGDSVLLGAGPALAHAVNSLNLDAVEGRQANVVLNEVVAAHSRGTMAPVVLIDTGNNGVISPDQLNGALSSLADRQRVIVLTDRVPRDWQDPNNQTIRTVSGRFPNVVLVDWYHDSTGQNGWFYEDGYHLNPTGASAFAQLIVRAARQ